MSADQQRQMQELQHQMARLQTEIDETKQREKQNPTPDFINEPLENNVPIDPENFKEMHAFMFDEPEVYGKWRQRQQQLNTDNFNKWRRKFNAHVEKNRMADHKKFLAESPYREQDLIAAWGLKDRPLKKLPSIATNKPRSKPVRTKQAPCKSKHVERKQTLSESDDDEPLAAVARMKPSTRSTHLPGFAPASCHTGGQCSGGYPAAPPQQEPRYPRGGDFDGDVFPGGSAGAGGLMGPDHDAFGSGMGGRFPGLPCGPGQMPPGVPPGARFDPFGPGVPMPCRGTGTMRGQPVRWASKSKHVENKQTLSDSDDDTPLAKFLRQNKKKMSDAAPSKTDFPQVVFPHDIKNDEQSGSSQQQFVELYNMFKIQQQKIEELEKTIDYDKI